MAIRTMSCIRVKDLNEYLLIPLLEALSDNDSYVKKVAIMTIPKLNELSPDLIQKAGVIHLLKEIVANDKNAYVVANSIVSL